MGEYAQYQNLERILAREKIQGKKVVLTGGCFDLIHSGHLFLLEIAKALGDILVVNVLPDERVKIYKGEKRPITPAIERARVVSAIEWVNYSTIYPRRTIDLGLLIRPSIIVQAERWSDEEKERLRRTFEYRTDFVEIGRSNAGTSTTSVIEEIKKRYGIERDPTKYLTEL